MILCIDNYDSFVHNLARHITQLGHQTKVVRNDSIRIDEIIALKPDKIVISPGPYGPSKAGISLEVVKKLGETIPILGVCLGHQVIGQAYGGKVIRALKPMHAKSSLIKHSGEDIFKRISSPLKVGRYHSLVISKDYFPSSLEVIAESSDGEIMALKHRKLPVYGVQFHPESIITAEGYILLNNFCTLPSS